MLSSQQGTNLLLLTSPLVISVTQVSPGDHRPDSDFTLTEVSDVDTSFEKTREQQVAVVTSPRNVDEVEEFVERIEGGEERLRRETKRYNETEVTSRGVEHRSVQQASVTKTSTVSSAALTGGHLPLPFSLSDAIKHDILDPETGMTSPKLHE